jgi:putative ABC transport system permease protein
MNLTIAGSISRTREIGIRKVLGIQKSDLLRQLTVETFILTTVAIVLSFLMILFLFPVFKSLSGLQVRFKEIFTPGFLGLTILTLLLIAAIGGLYPSLILASSRPALILKKNTDSGSNNRIGKFFLTLQFSLVLIVGIFTLTFRDQIHFMLHSDPGFEKKNILIIQLPEGEEYMNAILSCRNDLLQYTNIKEVSLAGFGTVPGTENGKDIVEIPGAGHPEQKIMNIFGIDENYIPILDLELLQGRNFLPGRDEGNTNEVLVNERLVRGLNWQDPLGKKVITGGELEKTVIGVVKDFHFSSMHNLIEPAVMEYRGNLLQKMLVKTDRPDIDAFRSVWKKHFPDQVLDYSWLEPFYDNRYENDARISGLFTAFSFIILFVAGLGFTGMCIMILDLKKKNIGIRIIFGAGSRNIFFLLLNDFYRVVLVSVILAIPISYFALQDWMSNFAYRVNIYPEKYIIPILFLICLILIIIASIVARTISTNPVKNLRMEEE